MRQSCKIIVRSIAFLGSFQLYGSQEFDLTEAAPRRPPVALASVDYIKSYLEKRATENGERLARKALDLMDGKHAEEIQKIWFYYKEESFVNRYIDLIEKYNRFVPPKKNKEELRSALVEINEQYNKQIKQLYQELGVPLSATTLIPRDNAQKLSVPAKKPATIDKLSDLASQIQENKQAVEQFNGRTARKNKLKMRYNKSIAAYYKALGLDVPLLQEGAEAAEEPPAAAPAEHASENRHVVTRVISAIRKYPLVFSVGTLAVIVAFYKLKHFNKKNLLI